MCPIQAYNQQLKRKHIKLPLVTWVLFYSLQSIVLFKGNHLFNQLLTMRHEYKETHTSHFLVPVFVLSCPVMSLSLEKDTQFHLDLTMTNSTVHDVRSSSKICLFVQPWRVSSDGIWGKFSRPQWWLNNSLPLLELQLFLFFLLMSIIHLLLKPFGVSKISSQIIVRTHQIPIHVVLFLYCLVLP